MDLGMIGLGRMGGDMTRRLLGGGHRVVAFDPLKTAREAAAAAGAEEAKSIKELVDALKQPRVIWLMVPAGNATEDTIDRLLALLHDGDIVIDGGNSNYHDTIKRAEKLGKKGIFLVDVGTSGGIWGLKGGYCLTVGGDVDTYYHLKSIFQTLAPSPDTGYGHVGPNGAGHFVKMIHNGIEYGLMQSYAEGFQLLTAKKEYGLDLGKIAEIWRHGSVVRSWILDLTTVALKQDPGLEKIQPYVEDSGEGRWTVEEAVRLGVPVPVISLALQMRFRSRQPESFSDKLLAALRKGFGGHAVKAAKQ